MTVAGLMHVARRVVGAKTVKNTWVKVDILEVSMKAGQTINPGNRGWFASAQGQDIETDTVELCGEGTANKERLGDDWVLGINH